MRSGLLATFIFITLACPLPAGWRAARSHERACAGANANSGSTSDRVEGPASDGL